jgi:hypothetical protein
MHVLNSLLGNPAQTNQKAPLEYSTRYLWSSCGFLPAIDLSLTYYIVPTPLYFFCTCLLQLRFGAGFLHFVTCLLDSVCYRVRVFELLWATGWIVRAEYLRRGLQ